MHLADIIQSDLQKRINIIRNVVPLGIEHIVVAVAFMRIRDGSTVVVVVVVIGAVRVVGGVLLGGIVVVVVVVLGGVVVVEGW